MNTNGNITFCSLDISLSKLNFVLEWKKMNRSLHFSLNNSSRLPENDSVFLCFYIFLPFSPIPHTPTPPNENNLKVNSIFLLLVRKHRSFGWLYQTVGPRSKRNRHRTRHRTRKSSQIKWGLFNNLNML